MKINELLNRGVVLLDKPSGITSYETVEKVKDILEVKKAGHAGTLANITLLYSVKSQCYWLAINRSK